MTGLTIPFEVADGITLANLKDQLNYLQQEIKDHTENGAYMHPEDYHNSMTKLIPSLKILVEYYGG